MKAVFLSTSSGETTKYAESLTDILGAEPGIVRYDHPEATDASVYSEVKAAKPDFIVYIGSRWGKQPSTSTLCQINGSVAPMVHLCSDAADPPWHDLLREYHNQGAFAVQVAIDGNDNWPGADAGLTLLTPIAASHFLAYPMTHSVRRISCGYAGNGGGDGSKRRQILFALMMKNLLTIRQRDDTEGSYEQYCDFLSVSRLVLNIPFSGTEAVMQVKGRVVEAGLAGACLLECRGSPTAKWFRPGVDYLEYSSIGEAEALIDRLSKQPEETEKLGDNLRARVLAEHLPVAFWGNVLKRIGLKA